MLKLSIPAIGRLILHHIEGWPYLDLQLHQLHANISIGEAGRDYGYFIFSTYLFKGWRDGCIPITKDLFKIDLGRKA